MEEEKREHDSKMKKMEAEMEQVFEMKVKEKKQKLKDSELELTRRHEERKKVGELIIKYFRSLLTNHKQANDS
jgi:septin 7